MKSSCKNHLSFHCSSDWNDEKAVKDKCCLISRMETVPGRHSYEKPIIHYQTPIEYRFQASENSVLLGSNLVFASFSGPWSRMMFLALISATTVILAVLCLLILCLIGVGLWKLFRKKPPKPSINVLCENRNNNQTLVQKSSAIMSSPLSITQQIISPSVISKSITTELTNDSCYVTSIEDDDDDDGPGPFSFHEPQDLNPYCLSRNVIVPSSLPPWTIIQQERIRIPKPSLQAIPLQWNEFSNSRRDSKSLIEVDRFSSYSEVILELKNRFSKV